jgi:1,4-dihydroxy-2-naphthoate octaprenyltransferase
VWTALPFGLFTLLLFFNYNAVHYRRDWLIHKRTLTVNLGLGRAMDLSALLTILAYISLLLIVTLTDLPLVALLALAALPMGLRVFARLDRDHLTSDDCLLVYRTSVHAAVMAGVLFSAALVLDKLM